MPPAAVVTRVLRGVGTSPAAERVAQVQHRLYGPVLEWVADSSVFHTDALGHSPHPSLTDLTVGCWLSASIVDAAGGDEGRRAATVLVAVGLGASVPTAITGAADWARMTGSPRRIGAVHALGTDVATLLFVGSLLARVRGGHAAGSRYALVGNTVMAAAGFLGAHLALNRGAARREGAFFAP